MDADESDPDSVFIPQIFEEITWKTNYIILIL